MDLQLKIANCEGERTVRLSILLAGWLFLVPSLALAGECCCEPCTISWRPVFLNDFCCSCDEESQDPFAERIETERHDFTQSTKTVGRGVVQVEAGYLFIYNDDDVEIESSHRAPEMLVRFGLTENIEFRLKWNYAWQFIDEADNRDSAEDMRWAFKLGMTEACRLMPESALEIRFTAPTGGVSWSTERVEFGLDYIYGWNLTEEWKLYGSTGVATNGLADFSFIPEEPTGDDFLLYSQSVAFGRELGERSTIYLEAFGLFTYGAADQIVAPFFNVGVDYYLTNDLVLDVRAGFGLNEQAEDFFSGIGGGYRF